VRTHLIWKWFALAILAGHTAAKILQINAGIVLDLFLFNLIIVAAIISLIRAPLYSDPFAISFTALAIASWGIGSLYSSLAQFFNFNANSLLFSNIAYALFYPFAFLAIPRILGRRQRLRLLELLDAAIFGLGLSSIVTALILIQFISNIPGDSTSAFFAVLYPVCDIALVVIAIVSAVVSGFSTRSTLLISGVMIFAITDFYFLWAQLRSVLITSRSMLLFQLSLRYLWPL